MIVADIKETSNETLLDYLSNAKATTLCSVHSKAENKHKILLLLL